MPPPYLPDPVAYEDATYWVKELWFCDFRSCAASLDVAEFVLEDWYNEKFKVRQFTDLMRNKIFEWAEKNKLKKQETIVSLPVASNGAAAKHMMDPPAKNPAGSHPPILRPQANFEDTKKWLESMWRDSETCLKELNVTRDELKAWYKGDGTDQQFTARLHSQISEIKDAREAKNKPPCGVVPVAATGAGVPVVTQPAGVPVVTKPAGAPVVTKPAGVPVAATGAGAPVAPKQHCMACRGKHEKHTCGKQKDPVQLLTSVGRPLQSGVANSGLQPRPPAVQAPTVVPAVVPPPAVGRPKRATLGKRVAELERIVHELKQKQTELLDVNSTLVKVTNNCVNLSRMLLPLVNNHPAPRQPMQEDSEDPQRALKKTRPS